MAIEKSLYKRNFVPSNKKDTPAPLSKAYRGMSTISEDSSSYSLYDINLIKQDLINHLHIRQGEKLENPSFGTIIWDLLFDPLTDDLRDLIVQNVTDIVNYDPRTTVENVIVSTYESGIQIELDLTYLNYSIAETLRFRFDQNNNILT